jgi:hypothetical protein
MPEKISLGLSGFGGMAAVIRVERLGMKTFRPQCDWRMSPEIPGQAAIADQLKCSSLYMTSVFALVPQMLPRHLKVFRVALR